MIKKFALAFLEISNDIKQNCLCVASILKSKKVSTEQTNNLKMVKEVIKNTYLYGTWRFVEGKYNSSNDKCLP